MGLGGGGVHHWEFVVSCVIICLVSCVACTVETQAIIWLKHHLVVCEVVYY